MKLWKKQYGVPEGPKWSFEERKCCISIAEVAQRMYQRKKEADGIEGSCDQSQDKAVDNIQIHS